MQAPLLPSEMLRRVLRVARIDGLSVLVLAGGFGLISAACGDVSGAIFGFLIAAAGALELRGVSLLRARRIEGMKWLFGSQLYLMAVILGYVTFRLVNLPRDPLLKALTRALGQSGMDMEMMPMDLPQMLKLLYSAVAVVTVLYQGGMLVYYLLRRSAVAAALQADETP
jgi:hypothetical protein